MQPVAAYRLRPFGWNMLNHVHLEDEGIDCYVKYPGWDRDVKGTRRRYEADAAACVACPVKDECTRGRARSLLISPDIRRYRQTALAKLASPMGVRMRSLRRVEVETPFGVQKHAYRFRRHHLRGIAPG